MGLLGKEEGEKLESSLQRTKDQQSIDPVDLMDKAFLAILKERYHLDDLKQIRDSKLFQRKSLDDMKERYHLDDLKQIRESISFKGRV